MEVFASSEEETHIIGGRFGDIEDVTQLPKEISRDGDTEHINRGGLLELRAGHEKRRVAVLTVLDIRRV